MAPDIAGRETAVSPGPRPEGLPATHIPFESAFEEFSGLPGLSPGRPSVAGTTPCLPRMGHRQAPISGWTGRNRSARIAAERPAMSTTVLPSPVSPVSHHGRAFVKRHLKPGETIVAAEHAYIGKMLGRGDDTQQNGEILVTTERVAFYRRRLLGGEILRTVPIRNITAVDRLSNALWAWLEIDTAGGKLKVGFPGKGDVRISDAIERVRELQAGA